MQILLFYELQLVIYQILTLENDKVELFLFTFKPFYSLYNFLFYLFFSMLDRYVVACTCLFDKIKNFEIISSTLSIIICCLLTVQGEMNTDRLHR